MIRKRGRPKKKHITKDVEILTTEYKKKLIIISFMTALRFQKVPDMDDWADENFRLPKATTHEWGKWRTQRFPFLRRIMKCLSPSSIAREIVGMKGSQLGFTTLLMLWKIYKAVCMPGPFAFTQKTEDDVKQYSKQKFKPTIDANPVCYDILGNGRPKGFYNSLLDKTFPGGFIAMGPANSTGFLKSKAIRDAGMDEEDEYELNVGKQGSPRKLLQRRMTNFPNSKLYRNSTPVLEEFSTIKPGWLEGSQEQYYVPCPNCNPKAKITNNSLTEREDGFMFLIEWDTIKWSKEINPSTGDPIKVWCECPACGYEINESRHKTWMLDHGDWYSTKNVNDPDSPLPRYKVGDVVNPSFRITSFYSPYGFYSWKDAVHDFFEYLRTRDVNLLQVFRNQVCAETFSLVGGEIDPTGLFGRRESYGGKLNTYDVPNGGLCLTAGVDIQDDRIEVSVYAWGLLEESYAVDYKVLVGDTELMGNKYLMLDNGQPSVWKLLDEYLFKKFKHESGTMMPIEVTMIDCGHKNDQVHKFCGPRESRRIFALKGKGGWGNGLWRRAKRRHEKYKTIDYLAFVDELKTKLYAFLALLDPGPGYIHFPRKACFDEKFFKGLTCEKRTEKTVAGRPVLKWENLSGARNEPIDTFNYSYVARSSYAVNLERRAQLGIPAVFGEAVIRQRVIRKKGHPGL